MRAEQTGPVSELIGRRRYCFVIMPYGSLGLLYEHLRQVIEEATGLKCIRADEVPGPGESVLGKVHDLIGGAELVIAELSEEKANVYYEVGYATALGKRVFVICSDGTKIPTNLQGLERMEYGDTPTKLPQFDDQLRIHLVLCLRKTFTILRSSLSRRGAALLAPVPVFRAAVECRPYEG